MSLKVNSLLDLQNTAMQFDEGKGFPNKSELESLLSLVFDGDAVSDCVFLWTFVSPWKIRGLHVATVS